MPQFPPGSPFEEFFKDFFERQQREGGGKGPPRQISSLGSGFIVDARGYVVTNNHVIADADQVRVILHDNTELEAKVRSEEHTSELQSLMRISYAVLCLKKKQQKNTQTN